MGLERPGQTLGYTALSHYPAVAWRSGLHGFGVYTFKPDRPIAVNTPGK